MRAAAAMPATMQALVLQSVMNHHQQQQQQPQLLGWRCWIVACTRWQLWLRQMQQQTVQCLVRLTQQLCLTTALGLM
jgi:hypothetical protein